MRSIRKWTLVGLAALMACAGATSAASAATVQDVTTHTALAAGDYVNGVSANSKLVGSFFGFPTTVTCTQSSLVAQLTANAPTPTADVQALTWTGCKNGSGNPCIVQTLNLPWIGAMTFTSTTNMRVVVPSNGGVQISGTGCLPLSSTCTFGAGDTVNFTWANVSGAPGTATVNQSVSGGACGTGTWTGTYVGRTGSTSGSGNGLEVV